MPFMKDLQRDLDEEGIELLVKKEKNAEGFSSIIDHLHKTFIHPSWPLSGLEEDSYNFDYAPPYSNFLNLNSSSLHLYVPIIPAMMMLFVPRKEYLSILILATRIILRRCISFYWNAIPSCQCLHGIETKQKHLLLTKVERRIVRSNGYQEMGRQNERITSYQ